jgi:hypothetical protein
MNDWTKKRKGNSKIYKHPNVDRAIVENFKGVFFDGKEYATVNDAKKKISEDQYIKDLKTIEPNISNEDLEWHLSLFRKSKEILGEK